MAGPIVRAACARHLADLKSAGKRGWKWDEEAADYALDFYPTVLRLNGGEFEGKPFDLHPSQAFIVGSLFGWRDVAGARRYRVAYIEEGKGNGKSPLVAGLGLLGLVADGEARAEIYAAATKKDQAMVLFRDAVAMVQQSVPLAKKLTPSGRGERVWNLYHGDSGSFFRPISSDDGQSGPRPHIGILDEVHEHKSNLMVEMMRAGFKTRRQPLIVMITNSGSDRTSVCWEYHEYARQVCEGSLQDDRFFGYVCGLDEGDDPFKDESCWPKANPLLGCTIDMQYLRDQVREARGMPSKESLVRRLNFCEWTEAHNPFMTRAVWMACQEQYRLDDFAGAECTAGLDLSATTDLTSCVLSFERDGRQWVWPFFWIPEGLVAEKTKKDKVPYDAWVRAGVVRTTPGKAIDKDFVADFLAKELGRLGIRCRLLAYDRHRIDVWNASCARVGAEFVSEPFGQGFISMAPAIDSLEELIVQGNLRHPGNPCLTWNMANAVVAQDPAGNRKFDKAKATGRIDGTVAMTMAVARAMSTAPEKPPEFNLYFI